MGIGSSTWQLAYLQARESTLQTEVQNIQTEKINVVQQSDRITSTISDLDSGSEEMKQFQNRKEKLRVLETQLDIKLQTNQTELQMINVMQDTNRKFLQQEIREMSGGEQ